MSDTFTSRRTSPGILAPVLAVALAALVGPVSAAAQGTDLLAITSPADGTVVAPGQTVVVTVTSPAGGTFTGGVGLTADDPIGPVGIAQSLPAQFSVMVPADAACRKYTLTAMATTEAGESAAASIQIDVEVTDMPGRVYARLPELVFDADGDTSALTLQAGFFDGSVFDVTQSTRVAYASSDPAVATVDGAGVVSAVGPGYAEVRATYGPAEANLAAVIPVQVPDPLYTAAPRSLDFGTHTVGTSPPPQQVVVTNTSGEPLAIVQVVVTGDFAVVDTCVAASPLPVDGTCTMSVSFAPTEAGPRDGTVQIATEVTTLGVTVIGAGAAPPVTISGFTPEAGPVGTTVVIEGSGFSALPSGNTVTFNGTVAVVTSASVTTLVVTVPAGATTGEIAVTAPDGSATSATPFTVTGPPVPILTGFTPTIGVPGTVVTIHGANFDPVPARNQVRFNLRRASPTAATASTVSVPVPDRAGSGHITLTTAMGTAVSRDDFIVAPAPYAPEDVAVSGRIAFGAATTVAVPADKIALLLFDGTEGQRVSLLGTEGTAGASADCDVTAGFLRSNNDALGPATCMEGSGFIDTKTLPHSGTYAILIVPAAGVAASVTLRLYDVPADATAAITPGGGAVTITTATPGQDASLTFDGTAGQRVSLLGADGMPGQVPECDVRVKIRNPDGSVLTGATCMEPAGFVDVVTLPATGRYTIGVDPRAQAKGGLTLTLFDVPADFSGEVTVGGPTVGVVLATPGQNGSLSLSGTAGTVVTVRLSGNTLGRVHVRLTAPDGTLLAARTSTAESFRLPAQTLPATGTYAVVVDPVDGSTGLLSVRVTSP